MKNGFSLVELSIVLVILGLLVGGILAGQSLIRAAELRSVSTDIARYKTAMFSFRDKYFQLPGDMSNATRVWGDDNTNCADAAIANGTPGTCNGDGDGIFDAGAGANVTGEFFQFWKQLALAGLIEGTYTGLAGMGSGYDARIGTNVPPGRMSNTGYSVFWWSNYTGEPTVYDGSYGNMMVIGGFLSGSLTASPVFKPEETWNIDTKLDDGKPGTGTLVVRPPAEPQYPNCAIGANSPAGSATYNLSYTSGACAIHMKFGL